MVMYWKKKDKEGGKKKKKEKKRVFSNINEGRGAPLSLCALGPAAWESGPGNDGRTDLRTDRVTYEWKGRGEDISPLGNDGCTDLRTDLVTYEWIYSPLATMDVRT